MDEEGGDACDGMMLYQEGKWFVSLGLFFPTQSR